MKDRYLLISFIIILLVFGLLLVRKYLPNPAPEGPIVIEPSPVVPASQREILLYFAVPGGAYLEAEGRDIADCVVEQECLRSTVQALIDGPTGNLVPVLPRQTLLRQISVEGDLVVVDFSKDFVNSHPGGSLPELLTVYSLVDSLAVNFPYVRQLRILVDGKPLETIKGHVDLRSPVSADFRYTRSSEPLDSLPLKLFEENAERTPVAEPPGENHPPR
jgi:Sporulation and spore germination